MNGITIVYSALAILFGIVSIAIIVFMSCNLEEKDMKLKEIITTMILIIISCSMTLIFVKRAEKVYNPNTSIIEHTTNEQELKSTNTTSNLDNTENSK